MTRPCSWYGLGLLLALAGVVGCNKPAPLQPKYTAVGFRTSTDGFVLSGGHLVAHPGKPGVTFGTTKPGKSPQLTYVILFKLPPPTNDNSLGLAGSARSLPQGGGAVESVCKINGKRVEATVSCELTSDHTAVSQEKMTIGGKEVDPGAGRLFVLDLAAATPTYQQKKVALPDEVPQLEETADVERYAEVLLKDLYEKEPELKDQLK